MSTLKRLIVVGDGGCGKTSLLSVFVKDDYPESYIPTILESHTKTVRVNGKEIELALYDTAGSEDYDKIRPLSYPNTNVVLLCFSVDNPASLENAKERWFKEIKHFLPDVPMLLVANKIDIREDEDTTRSLKKYNMHPVTSEEGKRMAKRIGADEYFECSAKTREGVEEVFKTAAKLALISKRQKRQCGFI